jgi:hypothetical protein
MVQAPGQTTPIARQSQGAPHLIFFCELGETELLHLLGQRGVLDDLVAGGYGVALALRDLGDPLAAAVAQLNRHDVPVVAWLLPAGDEGWFNLQNYPQAIERYRAFRGWSQRLKLSFQAVGIDIEPPASEVAHLQRWGLRDLARRFWLARDNVLFTAARAAYTDLVGEIHRDGYEVHAYQLPILADDRRAGTTLIQRAIDIVGLPADVEVLICYSSLPIDALGNDIGGALVMSYGPSADGIAVGCISDGGGHDSSADGLPPLSGEGLVRDLQLAGRYTDLIYVFSLEGCVARGLLPRIRAIDWDHEPQLSLWIYLATSALRSVLLAGLLMARFSRSLLAWLGWGLALALFVRQLRTWRRARASIDSGARRAALEEETDSR